MKLLKLHTVETLTLLGFDWARIIASIKIFVRNAGHRLFESVEQLEELLNKLLNQGGLIIKWDRKIKNKGNANIFNLAA